MKLTLLTNRATARFRARKFDGSLEDCDAALAIKPGHVKALYLPYISTISPLYLPCISPVSRHPARPRQGAADPSPNPNPNPNTNPNANPDPNPNPNPNPNPIPVPNPNPMPDPKPYL